MYLHPAYTPRTPYEDAILASPGLTAHIDFGVRPRDRKGSNHPAYTGTPVWTAGPPGCDEGAVDFPSASDHCNVPDDAAFDVGNTNFTLAVWVRRDEVIAANHFVASKNTNAWNLFISSGDKFLLDKYGVGNCVVESGTSPVDGRWHFYMVARTDSTTMALYKDGADVTSTITSQTLADNSSQVRFGLAHDGGGRLGGAVAWFSVWKGRVLTLADHRHLYALAMGGPR